MTLRNNLTTTEYCPILGFRWIEFNPPKETLGVNPEMRKGGNTSVVSNINIRRKIYRKYK